MKHLCKLIFLVTALSLAVGCRHDQQAEEVITCAQQLLETRPDSALAILDSIRDLKDNWPRSQRMHYELVYAQAQNKAFVSITTDSILLEVADYYNSHGTDNQRMMANYMVGCAYRDMGDAPSALKYMNLAVDAVNENDKDCDLATLMRIHSQMGGLYQNVNAFENELYEDSIASQIAWQIGDTISALRLKWWLACCLSTKGLHLKAISCVDSIDYFIKEHNLPEEPLYSYTIKSTYFLKTRNAVETEKILKDYEQKRNISPADYMNEYGDLSYYYRRGRYYNLVNQPDSAIIMFNRLIQAQLISIDYTIDKHGLSEESYRGLMEAYSMKGKSDSVIKYAKLYCQMNDSTTMGRSSEQLIRIQSLYDYTKVQDRALVAVERLSTARIIIILIIVSFIFVSLVSWAIYQKSIRVKQAKLIEMNREYQSLLKEKAKSIEELRLLKVDTKQYLKEKEKEIKELNAKLALYQTNVSETYDWNDERDILSCDIANHLHILASKAIKATPEELIRLLNTAKEKLPKFYSTIYDSSYQLTEMEIIVCTLIRFQFISSEIIVLTNHSSQSISNFKASINKKLFGIKGAKTLEAQLNTIR